MKYLFHKVAISSSLVNIGFAPQISELYTSSRFINLKYSSARKHPRVWFKIYQGNTKLIRSKVYLLLRWSRLPSTIHNFKQIPTTALDSLTFGSNLSQHTWNESLSHLHCELAFWSPDMQRHRVHPTDFPGSGMQCVLAALLRKTGMVPTSDPLKWWDSGENLLSVHVSCPFPLQPARAAAPSVIPCLGEGPQQPWTILALQSKAALSHAEMCTLAPLGWSGAGTPYGNDQKDVSSMTGWEKDLPCLAEALEVAQKTPDCLYI